MTDLWKELSRVYGKDTDKAAKAMVTVIRIQDPNWNYLQVILDVSLAYENCSVIKAEGRSRENPCAESTTENTDNKYPSTDLKWDPYNPGID